MSKMSIFKPFPSHKKNIIIIEREREIGKKKKTTFRHFSKKCLLFGFVNLNLFYKIESNGIRSQRIRVCLSGAEALI